MEGMEGMEGMKPCWKQALMEIFAFFFFLGGGEKGGDGNFWQTQKWRFVSISKGYFVARPTEELPAGVHT